MLGVGRWMFLLLIFSASSLCAQSGTNALPALAPPYPEIPPTFWQQHKVAVIIGGFLFIIAQSLWLYKMLMRLQPAVEPPENLVRAALTKLLNEPEDGPLLSETSRLVRRYFGVIFRTQGEEATTAEFIAGLEHNQILGTEFKTKIAAFLRECDAAKFSPVRNAKELDAVERALELVNEAEKFRANPKAAAS